MSDIKLPDNYKEKILVRGSFNNWIPYLGAYWDVGYYFAIINGVPTRNLHNLPSWMENDKKFVLVVEDKTFDEYIDILLSEGSEYAEMLKNNVSEEFYKSIIKLPRKL
jgi:hypothetical protein